MRKRNRQTAHSDWEIVEKQGRIHGYPSRVRVGRGSDEIDQLGSWAGAVTPKPPVNAKKAKCYRPTGGPTDRAGCRVAYTRLEIDMIMKKDVDIDLNNYKTC